MKRKRIKEEIKRTYEDVDKPSGFEFLLKVFGLAGKGILYLAGKRSSKPKRTTPLNPHSRESVMSWLLE